VSMLGRLGRLARLRQIAIPLLALETLDLLIEKTTTLDPLPDWLDLSICLLGLGALVLVAGVEALGRNLNTGLAADAQDLATRRLHDEDDRRDAQQRRERIENILHSASHPTIVFQPIVELQTGQTVGFEALSRFRSGTPDAWFADATQVGLGVELELKAIGRALSQLELLPPTVFLSVNLSPAVLLADELYDLIAGYDAARIVVELTEQTPVEDYHRCRTAIDRLRKSGVRLAVDDLGAGYASLRHVIALQPELIKLDRALADVTDTAVYSMIQTLVGLGRLTGATIIAEGIEDAASLNLIRDLGVQLGQGWHLGTPQPLAELAGSRSRAVPQPQPH
jgi:EAL domain-containing protein (putative c-di-GMP-specific phosphodiesterase class I)